MTMTAKELRDMGYRIVRLEPAGVWLGTTDDDYSTYNEDDSHRPDHAVELFTITEEYDPEHDDV